MTTEPPSRPRGTLATRTLAMPADANPSGDIFGGWVLAQMDIAGGITASARAAGRVATVAVDAMVFHRPVYVGDVLCTYADIIRIGRTSIAIHIEAWALRMRPSETGRGGKGPGEKGPGEKGRGEEGRGERVKVTQGTFTLVAIDDAGRPRPVPAEDPAAPEEPAA
jgi:acyl-CoA thioesterase YciA